MTDVKKKGKSEEVVSLGKVRGKSLATVKIKWGRIWTNELYFCLYGEAVRKELHFQAACSNSLS